ncbi:HET-domain-containing protein [Thozetella sp. PMI_491]|nr:HET-domain-containing protein [Thozetella sp. PMI_491]
MRLIDVSTLRVVNVRDDEVPEYAILSHTWGTEEEEVTFQEMIAYAEIPAKVKRKASLPAAALLQRKKGFVKIVRAAEKAKEYNLDYIWIDTCCIDKTSSAELSEAINSMYRWYQQANICFALLSDVSIQSLNSNSSVEVALGNSRWFTRGWTLQELIAPFQVTFFDMNWNPLGSKEDSRLCEIIRGITRIDIDVLRGSVPLQDVSVARRMEYASRRQTTRPEDMAYCLLGLFNVHLPLLYGEGNRAFLRLQEEILKEILHLRLTTFIPSNVPLVGVLATAPTSFTLQWPSRLGS